MAEQAPRSNTAQDIAEFIDAVQNFSRDLPPAASCRFDREVDGFCLTLKAPSPAHRDLELSGCDGFLEYSLGDVWTENLDAATVDLRQILAALDAIRDGKVREVRDRRTGVIYHVYRLKTRGLNTWLQDGQYSLWHWLRLKIRRVNIHTLPPLVTSYA